MAQIKWPDFLALLIKEGHEDTVNKYLGTFIDGGGGEGEGWLGNMLSIVVDGTPHTVVSHGMDSSSNKKSELLLLASSMGMQRAAFIFLAHGADPNCFDDMGRTPLQLAKTLDMRALLISAGAKTETTKMVNLIEDHRGV